MKIRKIIKKCNVTNYPEWGGYLQPTEILALIDIGVKVDKFNRYSIDRAKQMKAIGNSNPTWFYFYPNQAFLNQTSYKDDRGF